MMAFNLQNLDSVIDFLFAVKEFDSATFFETAPELIDRKFNRPKVQDLESGAAVFGADQKSMKVSFCDMVDSAAMLIVAF